MKKQNRKSNRRNLKSGFKVVLVASRQKLSAVARHRNVVYRRGRWTWRPDGCGPLAVCADLQSALRFAWSVWEGRPVWTAVEVWSADWLPYRGKLRRTSEFGAPEDRAMWFWNDWQFYAPEPAALPKLKRWGTRLADGVKLKSCYYRFDDMFNAPLN